MCGNVAEWVLDGYSETGYARSAGKTVTTAEAFEQPTKLFPRVLRGGSWELDAEDCRSAARMKSVLLSLMSCSVLSLTKALTSA